MKLTIFICLTLLTLAGCATPPENVERNPSFAYSDTADTRLGSLYQETKACHPDQSGFLPLRNGLDAFVARAVLAQRAERSIDAQYYLLQKDLIGRLFMDQLLKAADRGVRVRLLVDDMELEDRDFGARAVDAHPNVEVRIFNPFGRNVPRILQLVTRFGSVTRRMHNKSFTVDNQATVLGGRNIGDEYFWADPDSAYADLDVLGIGPVATEVSASFDQYWNHPLAYPVSALVSEPPSAEQVEDARRERDAFVTQHADSDYLVALRNSNLAERLRQDNLQFLCGASDIVSDNPQKVVTERVESGYRLAPKLALYFDQTQQEVIIFSPYFVPREGGVEFFTSLVQRGVRVRILTNSLSSTDVPVVHAGYTRHRKDLLRAGVELYELNSNFDREQPTALKATGDSAKAGLHAKSFVLDRERVFIGSLNLDPRSLVENTEIGVVVSSSEIAGDIAYWFDQNIERLAFRVTLEPDERGERLRWYGQEAGASQVFEVEPCTGFWDRIWVRFLRLFPLDSQI